MNKFLQPNPFLTGAAAELPAERQDDYLQAKLVFPGHGRREPSADAWGDGRRRLLRPVQRRQGQPAQLRPARRGRRGDPSGLRQRIGPPLVHRPERLPRHFKETVPEHRPGLDRLRPGLQLDAAPPALRPPGLRQGPGRHLSDAAVDGGGVPVRRPAPDEEARGGPPGHRRRVRHQHPGALHAASPTTTASTTRAAGSTRPSAATSTARAGGCTSSRCCATCRNC